MWRTLPMICWPIDMPADVVLMTSVMSTHSEAAGAESDDMPAGGLVEWGDGTRQ
jgi:hypothetical protein